MITIRLLGGAKKAVGKPAVNLDRPSASVSDILDFLTTISADPRLLQRSNLIITLNDVDSASLHGRNTMVKSWRYRYDRHSGSRWNGLHA